MTTSLRVLVFGAGGMLGHKLVQRLRDRFEVFATVHGEASRYARYGLLPGGRLRGRVEVRDIDDLQRSLDWAQPDVVLNVVGVVKQRAASDDRLLAVEVNAVFPQRLALLCRDRGIRLIHVSTDCVFSGRDGNYTEESVADAVDVYGRTKWLGEVAGEGILTLRTSMIGREIENRLGLVEWFLRQKGCRCRGFSRAIFSGLTTVALADLLGDLLAHQPDLDGLYHVSADPISKHDLLKLVNRDYQLGVTIEDDPTVICDRSLDSTRFRKVTGWRPEPWSAMIRRMCDDPMPYDSWEAVIGR